jgi:hypothetical protein
VSDHIPESSTTIPYIIIVLLIDMTLTCFIIVFSVAALRLQQSNSSDSIPTCLKALLCECKKNTEPIEDDQVPDSHQPHENDIVHGITESQQKVLASRFDHLCFWITLTVKIINIIIYAAKIYRG